MNKSFSSALALVAVIPSFVIGQNPSPVHKDGAMAAAGVAAPIERRMMALRMMDAPPMAPMMMMDAASMFLGSTGELQLTDAQVTKLAAIARRARARQDAMRERMDSAMTAARSSDGQDGVAPMMMVMMRRSMPTDAERKAQHEDDRDAFAVLTPDQLATAWETMGAHHAMKMRP